MADLTVRNMLSAILFAFLWVATGSLALAGSQRNVPYGNDGEQRFDVHIPGGTAGAPVIFLIHGGGWSRGDKAAGSVVENKVARWLPRGFIVVSANYRMLPEAHPLEQARDVARALAAAQGKAAAWGGDRDRFILMGHSAGAHLAALLTASPDLAREAGARPGPPILAVCSTRRLEACPQARRFAAKARSLGMKAAVLEQDLSHREINLNLGLEGPYTEAVEAFLQGVTPSRRP